MISIYRFGTIFRNNRFIRSIRCNTDSMLKKIDWHYLKCIARSKRKISTKVNMDTAKILSNTSYLQFVILHSTEVEPLPKDCSSCCLHCSFSRIVAPIIYSGLKLIFLLTLVGDFDKDLCLFLFLPLGGVFFSSQMLFPL